MLTFLRLLAKSLLIAAVLLVSDGVAAYGFTFLSYRFIETLGDMMLIEVAVLFIIAGLVDFYSSVGAVQFRMILGSKQEYSSSGHKDAEKKALVFLIAGVILLSVMVTLALYGIS